MFSHILSNIFIRIVLHVVLFLQLQTVDALEGFSKTSCGKNPHSTAHYQETRFLDSIIPFQKPLWIKSFTASLPILFCRAQSRNGPVYILIEPHQWSIDEALLFDLDWTDESWWCLKETGQRTGTKRTGDILEFMQRCDEQPFRGKLCSAAAQQRGKWFPWHPMWANLPVLCSSEAFKEHPVITAKAELKNVNNPQNCTSQ